MEGVPPPHFVEGLDFGGGGVAFMKRAEVAQYWEANAETWARHARAGHDIYRDGLNTPAFLDMLPPVHGLSGLDIGSGEGVEHTRACAARGQDACHQCRADLQPIRA
jgi:hypothetical protein